jgi:hypothetical protein
LANNLVSYNKFPTYKNREGIFIDLIVLEIRKAENIMTRIFNYLLSYTLAAGYLLRKLICFACESAR